MKRVTCTVVCMVVAASALAQKAMTDQQWANYAIKEYKLTGIRTINSSEKRSRQQIALITFLTYNAVDAIGDDIDIKLSELNRLVDKSMGEPESEATKSKLRELVADIKKAFSEHKGFSRDISRMIDLTKSYSKELRQIGIDKDFMLKGLSSYSKRVTSLEAPYGVASKDASILAKLSGFFYLFGLI